MCIIAAKPAGIKLPSEKTIEAMWVNNPDGAGLMYAIDGKVVIDKGYMRYNDFRARLDDIEREIDTTATPMVLHFRIKTHGEISGACCHPFPISDSPGALKKLRLKVSIGMVHNGIIHNFPRKGLSDTMEYVISQLAPLKRAVPNFYKNKDLLEMIDNAVDGKLVFLDKAGNLTYIGNFKEQGGILYSNDSYKHRAPYKPLKGKQAGFGEMPLSWIDETEAYVRDGDGMMYDAFNFMIDDHLRVYEYDWDFDIAEYRPDCTVVSMTGRDKDLYDAENVDFVEVDGLRV